MSVPILARLYHLHHSFQGEDLPYWLQLARQSEGPLLELGCGTGRISLPLAQAGHTVVGLDRDPGMLALLKEQAGRHWGRGLRVFVGDMTRYHLAARFPLVILPCNTLSTFPAAQRRMLFDGVRSHLAQAGRFVAVLPNPESLAGLPPVGEAQVEETYEIPETGALVQVSSSWQTKGGVVMVTWHYDHLQPDGRVARHDLTSRQEMVGLPELQAELAQAALRLDEVYGDFDGSSHTPDSPQLIVEIRPAQ
jgi:SAM-dependent methyltransferase